MTDPGRGPAAPRTGRRILLLVGSVGAGKGTQAPLLAKELGLIHLASGNLFRQALRDGTELGEKARAYMERGDLVPDEITIEMFMRELSQPAAARGAILDGFPRTVTQARALDATLEARGERIERVIAIDVPVEVLVARVAGRRVCPVCGTPYHVDTDPPRVPGRCDRDGADLQQRDDDRPEVVRARLDKQVRPMLEVLDYYERLGIVQHVDGTQPITAVTREILAGLTGGEDAD
ncbi:MAG: nucleoside monophosphate kinase [Chloroflexota bacterium]|nr:nucleoside monophosphate kinase [Chloroflexota bacterium]